MAARPVRPMSCSARPARFATIDLAALTPADGFTILGDQPFDNAGFSVSDVGDINGDGYDDLVVGAIFGDDGGANAGEAYVIYGKSGGFADINLGALDPARRFHHPGRWRRRRRGSCFVCGRCQW